MTQTASYRTPVNIGAGSWRATAGRATRTARRIVLRAASPLAILLLWELAARAGYIPSHVIAAPSQIGLTLRELLASGKLAGHLLVSLGRSFTGLAIGVGAGTALALVAGLSRAGEIAVDAPMQMLRTLPSLALVPLFILWLGVGEAMKIAMIAFGTAFPIYLTLFAGIRGVDAKLVEVARTLELGRIGTIRHVILPGALPSFFVGLRYSLGLSWLILVVVEQVNATEGLGFLANDARDFARTDVIVICLLIYCLLGLAIDVIVRGLERVALAWRPSFVEEG